MIRKFTSLFLLFIIIIACSKNAITGRRQFKLLPESELQTMGNSQYQQFLSSNRVISNTTNRDLEMVRRVGQHITRAVTEYYAQKGLSKELEGYKWEYNLVES